jgi:nucleotide-binding universal stress UspA family protein
MSSRALIAYDGSATAVTAVRATAALLPGAQAIVATLGESSVPRTATVTRAVPTISPDVVQRAIEELRDETRNEAERTAQQGTERARALGLDAQARAAAADAGAASALLELAHELAADVLVCGTRGRGAFTRALLGSTSTSLLHHADLPLLVVPDGAGDLGGPALLAYDGSEPAQRAIEAGGRLFAGRRTVVLHVWTSQYRLGLTAKALAHAPPDDMREIVKILDQSLEEAATATTQDGVERARAAGLDPVGETLESGAGIWRTVASAAREHGAAVVIAGARGIGGARSALLGSVSSGLIHNADLPVLVVPPETRD